MNGIAGFNLDFFAPHRGGEFVFFSLHGFVIFMIAYFSLTNPDLLLDSSCILLAFNADAAIKTCGFSGTPIVYNFVYFIFSAFLIKFLRPDEYSADQIFNGASILILISITITIFLYHIGMADLLQRHALEFFFIVSLFIVALSLVHALVSNRVDLDKIRSIISIGRVSSIYIIMIWMYGFSAYWTAKLLP